MARFNLAKRYTIDPVCGMQVDPKKAAAVSTFQGERVYFCAETCRKAFEAAPADYPLQPARRKGWWKRYLERLNKATGGKPPCCH